MNAPIAIDLFAGAGGLTLGLQRAGFNVMSAADSWAPAVDSYRLNFSHRAAQVDLADTPPRSLREVLAIGNREVDVVAGGPPCQGFSIQRIGRDDDDRNDLVLLFAEFVLAIRPKLFVMENVPGLLGKRGRRLAARFQETMQRGGYVSEGRTLNAADYGVPQLRKRVFFIGALLDSPLTPVFPAPTHSPGDYVTVMEAIGDLDEPTSGKASDLKDPLHRLMGLSDLNIERLKLIPPGGGFEDLPVDMRVKAHRDGADRIGHRNVYGRLHPDRPAGTITARFDSFTRGKFAHPTQDRNITLREGARLQTFPDSFGFQGSQEDTAALIGNAVPPALAGAVGEALFQELAKDRSQTSLSSGPQLTFQLTSENQGGDDDRDHVGRLPPSDLPSPV